MVGLDIVSPCCSAPCNQEVEFRHRVVIVDRRHQGTSAAPSSSPSEPTSVTVDVTCTQRRHHCSWNASRCCHVVVLLRPRLQTLPPRKLPLQVKFGVKIPWVKRRPTVSRSFRC